MVKYSKYRKLHTTNRSTEKPLLTTLATFHVVSFQLQPFFSKSSYYPDVSNHLFFIFIT